MSKLVLKLYLTVQSLIDSEYGQDLTEYALLASLIAMVCITGVGSVATAVSTLFSNIDKALFQVPVSLN